MASRGSVLAASALEALATIRQVPRSTATAGLLGLLAAVYSFRVAYQWYRLSHIPGPFLASISGLWMIKVTLAGTAPDTLKGVTDKYGTPFGVLIALLCASVTRRARC